MNVLAHEFAQIAHEPFCVVGILPRVGDALNICNTEGLAKQ